MYGEQSDRAEGDIHSGQVTLRKNDDGGVLRTRAERQMSKLKQQFHIFYYYTKSYKSIIIIHGP